MNAMKRFALLSAALMSFLTGCGTQQKKYGKLAAKSCRKFGYGEGDCPDGYEYRRSR